MRNGEEGESMTDPQWLHDIIALGACKEAVEWARASCGIASIMLKHYPEMP